MLATLKKCGYLLREESRLKWALVVLLAIIVTGTEAVGALLVFVLLGIITAPGESLELPLIGPVDELPLPVAGDDLIMWLAIGVAVFFFLRGILLAGQVYVQDRIAYNAGARLSVRLLNSYLEMPYVNHLTRNSSELIRNAYESVRAMTIEVLIPSVRLVSNVVLAVGMLAVLLYAAPGATALAVAFLGPMLLLLVRVVQPRLKRLGRLRQDAATENLKVLQQSLHGIRDVVLYDRVRYFRSEFRRKQHKAARISYLNRFAQELPKILLESTLMVFIAGFLVFSVTVSGGPSGALAVLGLFAYAALRIQPALHKIVQSLNSVRFAGAAVDHVYADLKAADERPAAVPALLPAGGPDATRRHEISLEHVWFQYAGTPAATLSDIDLVIAPGESIGIVGPTGGGKSTLLDIIAGLLVPSEGRVLIDGLDLRDRTRWWQHRLGVVSQSIFLLDDSVRRNIAFGVPDAEVDDARMHEAIEAAQLADVVDDLPDGLDSLIGERGLRLSGGQRQRLAIARALYRDPSVLVLDEGTSALDGVTESAFMHALERLSGDRTVIMVAHRLTTVRKCDRVVVVEGGRIVDVGRFADLALRNPRIQVGLVDEHNGPAKEVVAQ